MRHARARAVSLAAMTGLLLLPLAPAAAATLDHPGPANGGEQSNAARAAPSYQSLQTYLAVPDGSGLYHEQYPVAAGDNPYSYEWPFSQAHIALADLANQPGARGRQFDAALDVADAAQEHYWKADGGSTGLPGEGPLSLTGHGTTVEAFVSES